MYEINESKWKPRKVTGTEKTTKEKEKSAKTGKDKGKHPHSEQYADRKCLVCSYWYANSFPRYMKQMRKLVDVDSQYPS